MSKFEVTRRRVGKTTVVRARGYIGAAAAQRLEAEVDEIVGTGCRRVLINFRDTDIINSVGISILIGVIERVQEVSGELFFSELSSVNREIFRLMGLHRHARVIDGDEEALGAGGEAKGGVGARPGGRRRG